MLPAFDRPELQSQQQDAATQRALPRLTSSHHLQTVSFDTTPNSTAKKDIVIERSSSLAQCSKAINRALLLAQRCRCIRFDVLVGTRFIVSSSECLSSLLAAKSDLLVRSIRPLC
jgi:hypothetical protein